MPEQLREAIKKVDASFRAAAQGVQAMSVGIVYDQELVWEQGYGLIDTADPSSYPISRPPSSACQNNSRPWADAGKWTRTRSTAWGRSPS
jgi:hypothetical protein